MGHLEKCSRIRARAADPASGRYCRRQSQHFYRSLSVLWEEQF
jgi:hypothetical protein